MLCCLSHGQEEGDISRPGGPIQAPAPSRGHGSALPPYNLSALAVGRLEGARPELFCPVSWRPLFSALLSPFSVLGKRCPRSKERASSHLPGWLDWALGGGVQPGWVARGVRARRGPLKGLRGPRAPVPTRKASEVVSPVSVQVLLKVTRASVSEPWRDSPLPLPLQETVSSLTTSS